LRTPLKLLKPKVMFNFSTKEQRKLDEQLYSVVTDEIERNEIYKPLWTKALADSDNDKQRAQALYIKYRVQKLKDEMRFEKEREQANERARVATENKRVKSERSITTLETTTSHLLSSFKWLTAIMLILGAIGLFLSYITISVSYDYSWWVLSGLSVLLFVLGGYLLFDCFRISKISDHKILKKKLNTSFLILIPFSLVGTIIGIIMPLVALFMFISFVALVIHAIKFNRAFNYAKRNGLI